MSEWVITLECDVSDPHTYASVQVAAEYYSADMSVNCAAWGGLSSIMRREIIAHELAHILISPLVPRRQRRSGKILEERVCTILQRNLAKVLPVAPTKVCQCSH